MSGRGWRRPRHDSSRTVARPESSVSYPRYGGPLRWIVRNAVSSPLPTRAGSSRAPVPGAGWYSRSSHPDPAARIGVLQRGAPARCRQLRYRNPGRRCLCPTLSCSACCCALHSPITGARGGERTMRDPRVDHRSSGLRPIAASPESRSKPRHRRSHRRRLLGIPARWFFPASSRLRPPRRLPTSPLVKFPFFRS